VQIVIPVIVYCLLVGTYGSERDGPRNGPAATAGVRLQ
jgi:hypothetical protein